MTLHQGSTFRHGYIAVLIWAALGSWGTAASDHSPSTFETLTVEQLADRLPNKTFTLINVHVPYEGELPSTDAFIPFDAISEELDRLPADRGAVIVLYCRSGRMSEIAATELAKLGYWNVSHLAGGMVAWEKAGHPLLYR